MRQLQNAKGTSADTASSEMFHLSKVVTPQTLHSLIQCQAARRVAELLAWPSNGTQMAFKLDTGADVAVVSM